MTHTIKFRRCNKIIEQKHYYTRIKHTSGIHESSVFGMFIMFVLKCMTFFQQMLSDHLGRSMMTIRGVHKFCASRNAKLSFINAFKATYCKLYSRTIYLQTPGSVRSNRSLQNLETCPLVINVEQCQ